MNKYSIVLLLMMFLISSFQAQADSLQYKPSKVVYDVTSDNVHELENILDRASMLQNVYGNDPFESSIVLVIHEGAIKYFTRDKTGQTNIERRAASLAAGDIIQFRVCRTSAKMQGIYQKDFNNFIQLVHMADAEIIKLQQQGFSYLR